MNIRGLSYLVALADNRHFSRAAAARKVSQPTLSAQIRRLEEELGVELVSRKGRQITLTPVGEEVVDKARKILLLAADIVTTAESSLKKVRSFALVLFLLCRRIFYHTLCRQYWNSCLI